jgi:formylglycine-generating enzyme required for sulfatase activity
MSNPTPAVRPENPAGSCDPQNPWPGLLQYQEADRDFFRGRELEVDELLRLLRRARLSLLFGLSGLGKSSLLQAGLFPQVRAESLLPVYIRLDFKAARLDLQGQVLQAVLNEAAASGIEPPPAPAGKLTLWEFFHHADADFWDRKNRPVTPLLVFDQFEEIFTLGRATPAGSAALDAFLDELSDLAQGRAPGSVKVRLESDPHEASRYSFARHNYKLLFAIREDFLPELESLRDRFPELAFNRMRLQAMNGAAALKVVLQAPDLVDLAVGERIVRFVAAAKPAQRLQELDVDPAILSVICYELNKLRQKKHEPKITEEALEGRKEEALNRFCERAFEGLPRPVRYFVEDKLLTVTGHRDKFAEENAFKLGITQEAIDTLVKRRLLRREQQREVVRLELAHDRLAEPLRSSRDFREGQEFLRRQQVAAEEAAAREREARERELKALAELRRARRQVVLVIVSFVAILIASALAVYATLNAARVKAELLWKDSSTGLTWLRRDNGDDVNELAAKNYCTNLRTGGYSDWRLPRVPELLSLTKSEIENKHHYVFRSGDVWTEAVPGLSNGSQAWLQTPDSHWTVPAEGNLGDRALCARGASAVAPDAVQLPASFAFVGIPAGEFEMGCSSGDQQCTDDERPQHHVVIARPFEMSKYMVTQALWKLVMGSNPSYFKKDGADRPVDGVNWFDAQVFMDMLNQRHDGYHYRLPTEAEWEYAARAGTTGPRYGDLDKIAWYIGNSDNQTHPVGQKAPNAWGLYDMLGNNWKWVQDPYLRGGPSYTHNMPQTEPYETAGRSARVRRGGSWVDLPLSIRASRRIMDFPYAGDGGFFVVREPAR